MKHDKMMIGQSLGLGKSSDGRVPLALEPRALPLAPYSRPRSRSDAEPRIASIGEARRIGLIHNAQARHNRRRGEPASMRGVQQATPRSLDELRDVLGGFAADGIDALIVDGGDGTLRDVASAISRHHPDFSPLVAIVPSGKTNALALELGIAAGFSVDDAVRAIRTGRVREQAPIELWRPDAARPYLRGFIFGAGAFVRATALAQTTHRLGAFNGVAVGLSVAAAVAQTALGSSDSTWRRGETMHVATDGEHVDLCPQYLLLASTLSRMPLGIKPFGAPRPGLKLLRIDAPPRRIFTILPGLLRGAEGPHFEAMGYHRSDARRIELRLPDAFTLDGETFAGGDLSLRQGVPIRFAVP